jgi:Mrp family chromosome partitioning ATPase/uncharacterized protein involved in exopolysaccharide biosynthesis
MNETKKYISSSQISTGFTITDDIKVNNENFSFYEADTKFNNVIVTFTSPTVINLLSYTIILHDLENANPFRTLKPDNLKNKNYQPVDVEAAKTMFQNKLETMSMLYTSKPEEKRLLEYLAEYGYDYKSISRALNIYRLQRTDYIQIDFASENPELSAFVVNNIFHQFLRYFKNVRSNRSQESIDTLQSLLEKKKLDLDRKNDLLKGQGTIYGALDKTRNVDILTSLEKTLTDEKSKENLLFYTLQKVKQRLSEMGVAQPVPAKIPKDSLFNSELYMLRKGMNDAYAAYVNSGSTDKSLLSKYNSLKTEYQNKYMNSGPSNNERTENNTSDLTQKKNDLIEKKNDLEVDLQATTSNIDSIEYKISRLKGAAIYDESKGVATDILLKDVELANKEYLEAKQKYNDAIDINSSSVNNFRQVLVGQPAIDPEPSKRILIVGLAGASVLIISILIILLLAYLDSSVKTPAIFLKAVNLKLISLVNHVNLKNKILSELVSSSPNISDEKDKRRHNVFRESLRKLRYEIESSGKKIFLFTSLKKGEGKTTLIEALSYSMSSAKRKILVIDTNFSNNDLTVNFHADPILEKIEGNGIGSMTLLEKVRSVSKEINDGKVFVIGSEGGDYTPSEILPRDNILHHLQELTDEYDYIFLEGPPLNDYSDSRELAMYVEGVVAVFSANHIMKQIDRETISFFHELNGKFIGAILNMIDLENINVE